MQLDPVLFGIVAFGLLHGANPSHGWIVAALYSVRGRTPLRSSIISSGMIASAHFLSSIVVVVAYILVTRFVEVPQLYLNYVVAGALAVLAYIFWNEKGVDPVKSQHGHLHHDTLDRTEHEHMHWHEDIGNHVHLHVHEKRSAPTLAAMAGLALALGFAHEEEFVILTLAVSGMSPLILMLAYATSVSTSLIGITVLVVKLYARIEHRAIKYAKYLPKLSAAILAAMAAGFALGFF
ncbi:MAG: nickel/cobalt transporter [Thermoproteota archaeon]